MTSLDRPGGRRRAIDPGVVLALFLVVLLIGVRLFLFELFVIPSGAMEPTVTPGDYVVASRFAYGYSRFSLPFSFRGRILGHQPQPGDVVLFKSPRDNRTSYIKRLIGVPGDRIQLKAGVVYLNGRPLSRERLAAGTEVGPTGLSHPVERFRETLPGGRSYLTNAYGPDGDFETTGLYVVPPGQYFVLGDNRDNTVDSRLPAALGGGYVPFENLIARADVAIALGQKNSSESGPVFRSLK